MASKHSKGKRAKQKDLDEDLKTSKNRKKKQKSKMFLHIKNDLGNRLKVAAYR